MSSTILIPNSPIPATSPASIPISGESGCSTAAPISTRIYGLG